MRTIDTSTVKLEVSESATKAHPYLVAIHLVYKMRPRIFSTIAVKHGVRIDEHTDIDKLYYAGQLPKGFIDEVCGVTVSKQSLIDKIQQKEIALSA
jgi:hypothetical protein